MSYPPPPGGPPGGPPPGGPYQQQPPGYGYGGVPPEHPKATTIMVLGILGFLCFILSIIAIVMGATARKEIASGMYSGETKVNVGFFFGIGWLVLGVLVWIISLSAG